MRTTILRWWAQPSLRDVVALIACVAFSVLFVYPAFGHGGHLGPYAYLNATAVTRPMHPLLPRNLTSGDLVTEMTPWAWWNWTVVHSGHFPLWNPWTLLGMPQFLNFQSAPLSLPSLVSYLFPRSWVLLIIILTKLSIASTGLYVAARTWHFPRWVALFAAITFAYSGSFSGWLGWPMTGVFAWLGWAIAFETLCWRGPRRFWPTLGLGLVLTEAVYAGHPGSLILFAFTLTILFGLLAFSAPPHTAIPWRPWLRATTTACLIALGLTAPLLLPGMPLLFHSIEPAAGLTHVPPRMLITWVTAHYFGNPVLNIWFGPSNYYETAADIGPIAAGFALLALAWSRGTWPLRSLWLALILLFLIIYAPDPLATWEAHWTVLGFIAPTRLLIASEGLLALGAAWGVWQWTIRWRTGTLGPWPTRVFAALLGFLLFLGARTLWAPVHPASFTPIRWLSLWWPVCLLGFALIILQVARSTPWSRWAPVWIGALLTLQTGWLLFSSAPLNVYTSTGYLSTVSTRVITQVIHHQVLGLAHPGPADHGGDALLGWLPEMNLPYQVDEFAAYDPLVPALYDTTWQALTHHSAHPAPYGLPLYVPSIASASIAQAYGIAWVLSAAPSSHALTQQTQHVTQWMAHAVGVSSPMAQAWTTLWQWDVHHPSWQAAVPWATPHAVVLRLRQALRHPQDFSSSLRLAFSHWIGLLTTHPTEAHALWQYERWSVPSGMQSWIQTPRFTLSHVPHSALATVTAGTITQPVWHFDAQFSLQVQTSRPATVTLHLTTVPGWHVTRNAVPTPVRTSHPLVDQVRLPPGHWRLTWTYRPTGWVVGELVALGTCLVLLVAIIRRVYGLHRR